MKAATSSIKEVNECIYMLSLKTNADDRQKYSTMIRAKMSSLQKTIGNMEHTLRDMATGVSSANNIEVKRHELDDIKRSQEQLEQAMSQQGNYTFLPESQQTMPRAELERMSRSDLYNYRNTIMRAQDRELDMLDTSADAIKNISTHIRDEVDLHSSLLGDLESAVDSTHTMVSQNREFFTQIIERSSKRRLMVYIIILTIILLFILLI